MGEFGCFGRTRLDVYSKHSSCVLPTESVNIKHKQHNPPSAFSESFQRKARFALVGEAVCSALCYDVKPHGGLTAAQCTHTTSVN